MALSEPDLYSVLDIAQVVRDLSQVRRQWRDSQQRNNEAAGRELPSRDVLAQVLENLRGVLFPMRLGPSDLRPRGEDFYVGHALDQALHQLLQQVQLELIYHNRNHQFDAVALRHAALDVVARFSRTLPEIRELLDSDVTVAFASDPAAGSVDEVLLCYPGIEAMIYHRIAHRLHQLGVKLLARLVAEEAHARTGIDIHPGAKIGAGFFIDHGTGVVIGETAVIGKRVRIYQAVTLGSRRFPVDAEGNLIKGMPRHPTVEDDVVIYAGATVLGRITIGAGASIGGNLWVTHDVAPGTRLAQARAQREEVAS